MKIRKATEEDALAIAKVHVQSWKETYAGIISKEYLDSLKVEERHKLWGKMLSAANPGTPVYVAVNETGDIVGFASFGKERTGKFTADGELYAIYILEKHKRNKLGLSLLEEGARDMIALGFSSMLVWVLEKNESRKFYETLGAKKAGEEIDTIGGQEHLELAYIWKDLKALVNEINSKSQNKNPLS